MKFIPTALALALCVNGAHASESWFEIELIVFERHGQNSAEQDKRQPQNYVNGQRVELVREHLIPVYQDCPVLSQQQRHELIHPLVENEPMLTPLSPTNLEEASTEEALINAQVVEPTMCYAPDETLLAQAYQIRSQRLLAQQQAIDELATVSETFEQTVTDIVEPATALDEELVSPDQETLIPLDPLQFIPYPQQVEQQGITYLSQPRVAKSTIKKVDVQLSADALATELTRPHLLDQASLQLTPLRQKLRWQKSLTPILHIGWRQPVYARHIAKPFHLFSGVNFAADFNQDGSEILTGPVLVQQPVVDSDQGLAQKLIDARDAVDNAANDQLSLAQQLETDALPLLPVQESVKLVDIIDELTAAQPIDDVAAPLWALDGMLKIYLNRFLFIEADFDLRKPGHARRAIAPPSILTGLSAEQDLAEDAPDNAISLVIEPELEAGAMPIDESVPTELTNVPWLNSHQLLQNRRVRSKEIHYFDHPNLGLVIQIRRFKLEQPQPQE